ncbi:MAG: HNH endonuclease [Roseburia sp.]|nr:HNH endonuclease [Roseburia sp.]
MAGYDLKDGRYEERNASDDELWSAFARVFSSKSRNDSSYKYGFLKAIIDNLYNVDKDLKLTFDQLFSKFGEIYWNLILKHGLRQKAVVNDNRETYLEQVLHSAVKKYNILEPIPYESLTMAMMADISHQVKVKCKKYVVGALFEDTNRLFYSFSKQGEWIQINPVMYEFVCKHKVVIEKLNYYEWARFLEKVNEDSIATRLLDKIDESAKRNNLSVYRRILYDEFESKNCFYCGKPLKADSIDVDHFIPWSFIKDDNLWNLVLACPACNRGKNDRLPDGRFLANIIDRNQHILIKFQRPEMQNYRTRMISYVYNWAKINGYDKTWSPNKGDCDRQLV